MQSPPVQTPSAGPASPATVDRTVPFSATDWFSGQAAVRWREFAGIVLLVIVADLAIYRGHGFAGYALLFSAAPLLLALAAPRTGGRSGVWLISGLLLLLAVRLAWSGTGLLVGAGFALLVAFAMALAGLRPYVIDALVYACQAPIAGMFGIAFYERSAGKMNGPAPRTAWLSVLLPVLAVACFGTLFVLANPDVAAAFGQRLRWAFTTLQHALERFAPSFSEVLFWGVVAWFAVGLLRPIVREPVLDEGTTHADLARAESPLYPAFRNMLIALIALFAAYLAFEFKTLWFRVFPPGFYYSGYAHEGAAWLTVALALATVVLSIVFRKPILADPRLPSLRRLAWIWAAANLLLAVAVYNRLFIYIGFNGMTRMRTVGLFGISAVVVGFVLVVWKITRGRSFVWLVHRQMWALALAVYLFAVTPVDPIVHTYNVRRILAGDPAPSVQISVHPIDSAGVLVLPPLVESDDPIIREGVQALLAKRALQLEQTLRQREDLGWTSYQLADRLLLEKLRSMREEWDEYADAEKRAAALERFDQYAYQWY